MVSFSDLQADKTSTTKDAGFPERPLKVSKLLQDRIRVLENAVQEHLMAAKETILQAEMDEKQERAPLSGTRDTRRGRGVKGVRSGKDSPKPLESVERHKQSAQKKGKRLRKPKSESSECSAERQTYGTHPDQREKEEDGTLPSKERHAVSMLEIAEKTTVEEAGKSPDETFNRTVKEDGLPPKSILKERKNNASKPDNLTKTVNKTIRQLYKLNKVNEAENLSDLLESKLMTEKELSKAIKRELQEEKEERKRLEAKNFEKSRREAFFLKMEELERLEEEMRETRMREREKRRAEAQKRREKNIALWNEKQKSSLSSKISRAFKFSYFPLLTHDSRSSSSDERPSSDDNGSSSGCSATVSRQNSACRCTSSTNKRKSRDICSSHSRQKKKRNINQVKMIRETRTEPKTFLRRGYSRIPFSVDKLRISRSRFKPSKHPMHILQSYV